MAILYRDEVNTEDKVKAYFYMNDALFDPFSVKYTIYQPGQSGYDQYNRYVPFSFEAIGSQTEKDALRFDTGHFYADWTVSNGAIIGLYKVIWIFNVNSGDPLCSKASTFHVVRDLNEGCEARHFPPDGGNGGGNGDGPTEQSGTCNFPCGKGIIRDHFGRIIYP